LISQTFRLYYKLLSYLTGKTKKSIITFLALTLFGAFLDILNFSLLSDAVKILLSPDKPDLSFVTAIRFVIPDFQVSNEKMVFVTLFFIVILCRFLIAMRNLVLSGMIGNEINRDLVNSLFSRYIHSNYIDFYKSSTSIYFTRLTSDINNITSGFSNILQLILEVFTTLSIVIFFLVTQFWVTISVFIFFILIGILYFRVISKKFKKISEEKVFFEQEKYRIIDEGLKGYVEITIFGIQRSFIALLNKWTSKLAKSTARQYYINNLPRVIIENLFLAILVFYIVFREMNLIQGNSLATGSIVLMGLLRLTPSVYRITILLGSSANPYESLRLIIIELQKHFTPQATISEKSTYSQVTRLDHIDLDNISFSYVNASGEIKKVLQDFSFRIDAPGMYGIMGKSGSGKSTLLELLLGFRKSDPAGGEIYINNIPMQEIKLSDWHSKISYIPQHSTFFEATILENICVDLDGSRNDIDLERVDSIIKLVKLDDLINQFELKLHHKLDQNARNISGGQRQRLALARALYKSPELLILDESTNALDKETEMSIFEDLKKISETVLIIFVAHNKRMYKHCQGIIELGN
jgi:ABC-type bacteriocin/lantibiotic exporter with double-glycine peptidase domain